METERAKRLANFVSWVGVNIEGDEKGEAQVFLDRFFQAFGHAGLKEAGATLEERIKKADGGRAPPDGESHPPPIRSGPLHPTRQGPSPSASPWWVSRPRHVSFLGIMPPRGRGPGLDMSVWMSPPTPRNADAVRDACRLRHSDLRPRPGRSSRGRGPSPGHASFGRRRSGPR